MQFLTELVVDSNNICDIASLSECMFPHLQRIEIRNYYIILDNNMIVDGRAIFKSNFNSLTEIRY